MTIEYSARVRTSPNGEVTYSVHVGQKLLIAAPTMALAGEIAEALSVEFNRGKEAGNRAAKIERRREYSEIPPGAPCGRGKTSSVTVSMDGASSKRQNDVTDDSPKE